MGRADTVPEVAFVEQADALWERAFTTAHRVLGSTVAAEEVAEEALLRAYTRWPAMAAYA